MIVFLSNDDIQLVCLFGCDAELLSDLWCIVECDACVVKLAALAFYYLLQSVVVVVVVSEELHLSLLLFLGCHCELYFV